MLEGLGLIFGESTARRPYRHRQRAQSRRTLAQASVQVMRRCGGAEAEQHAAAPEAPHPSNSDKRLYRPARRECRATAHKPVALSIG